MSNIVIRPAIRADLAQITSIYNHYILNTPITFDIEPVGPEQRVEWFNEHTEGARYRLLVSEEGGRILGYAGTGRFRDKAAYDTTAEVTIYCAPDATGRGIGRMMYERLFDALRTEDLRAAGGGHHPSQPGFDCAPPPFRLHRGRGFLREWPQVRPLLGRALDGAPVVGGLEGIAIACTIRRSGAKRTETFKPWWVERVMV